MSETIFFSYSRADSEFVLNLAKSLRAAGANIWLDQLDIKPGTRWDKSIEKALDTSNTLLVVLSKSAVESTNVMDEVSFALEEKKKVVPVLLEPCTIPFRLRRLQFADFSKDKLKGIDTLIDALSLDKQVAIKLSDVALSDDLKSPSGNVQSTSFKDTQKPAPKPSQKPVQKVPVKEPVVQRPATPKYTKPEKKSKSVWPFILIGILIVAAAGGYYFKDKIFIDNEKQAWEVAIATNNVDAYKEYQKNYPKPKGKHYDEAQLIINQLQEDAWNEARSIDNIGAYEAYKLKFKDPNGKYFDKAEKRIIEINKKENELDTGRKQDSIKWTKALQLNTKEAYIFYIDNKTSQSEYVSIAVDSIESITQELFVAYASESMEEVNSVENSTEGSSENTSIEAKKSTEAELEKTAWEKAKDRDTFDAYMAFIRSDDNRGQFHNEAVNALENKGKTGWLYVGRTNDDKTFSSDPVVSVIYRKNSSITNLSNDIPKVGDLIILNGSLGRRAYSRSSPRDTQTGLWNVEKKAYVSTIKMEGQSAIIAEIIFN